MRKTNPKILYYQCEYCGRSPAGGVPLIQLGQESSLWDDLNQGEERISPEDSNDVEICKDCLEKALRLFDDE